MFICLHNDKAEKLLPLHWKVIPHSL